MGEAFLRKLDAVTKRYPEGSRDPIQDIINRGVDPRALDDFIHDCLVTAMHAGVPGPKVQGMLMYSCFHMGMLTQSYLDDENARIAEEEDDAAP
jgi:hypothetical protein